MFWSSRLNLQELSDRRIVLRIPVGFKLLLLGIAVIIFSSIIFTSAGGRMFDRANTLPLLLCAFSLLAAAYQEQWIFDRDNDLLKSQFGIFPLFRTKRIKISELEVVSLNRFVRGNLPPTSGGKRRMLQRDLLSLTLVRRDGQIIRIETYRAFEQEKIKQMAGRIADYCGIPLAD